MSPGVTGDLAPGRVARITGGVYLAYILASVLAAALGQNRARGTHSTFTRR